MVGCSYFSGTGFCRVTIFRDDAFGGFVEHRIYFVIAGLGAIPGVGDVFVAAGVDFVHEQLDLRWIELAPGDATHVIDDVAGHGVNFIKVLKISGGKATGALVPDVDAVVARDFLGKGVGGFAVVVPVGAGAIDFPVETGCAGFFAKDTFGEGATANIPKANH